MEADPAAMLPAPNDYIPSPNIPSPSPTKNFMGLDDIRAGGISVIPPDTQGAVGLDAHVHDAEQQLPRAGPGRRDDQHRGDVDVLGGDRRRDPFDPEDGLRPVQQPLRRVAAVSNAQSVTSSILLGRVEHRAIPTGRGRCGASRRATRRIPCGGATPDWWADYPEIGFNVNWVAVTR